jgi:hypothetical protein
MTLIHKFLSALAIAGKSVKKLQETVKKVDGNKALKRTKIYEIIKKLKERRPDGSQLEEACQEPGIRGQYHHPLQDG